MPTPSDHFRGDWARRRATAFAPSFRLVVVLLLSLFAAGCGSAPQFAADEECLGAVDALWTAITSQQKPWLENSVGELERLRDSGRLSPEAWEALAGPIAQAREGQWEPAARELRELIKAQRKASQP